MVDDYKVGNDFKKKNIRQVEKITAYGIDGFSVVSDSNDSLENKDIRADKKHLRE